jgi:hypothetical protein
VIGIGNLLMMGLYTSLIDSGWREVIWLGLGLGDRGTIVSPIDVYIGRMVG